MVQRRDFSQGVVGGRDASADPYVDRLIPVVDEIRRAISELRVSLDDAVDGLRRQIEGRHKSHYTIEEVADLTGRAPYTVRAWIKKGLIAANRVTGTGPKGRLLVPCEEIQRLVEGGRGRWLPPITADGSVASGPSARSTGGPPNHEARLR